MGNRRYIPAVLAAAFLMSGCSLSGRGAGFQPDQSSIYINRSGQLQSAAVENFDKEYYSKEELMSFVQEKVSVYNSSHTESAEEEAPVVLQSCQVEDGKAVLILGYGSPEHLTGFAAENQDTELSLTSLSVRTVEEAMKDGDLMNQNYKKAKDQSDAAAEEVAKEGKLTVVSLEGQIVLQTEGKVQYYSDGVEKLDDHTVRAPEGKSYIIFK